MVQVANPNPNPNPNPNWRRDRDGIGRYVDPKSDPNWHPPMPMHIDHSHHLLQMGGQVEV